MSDSKIEAVNIALPIKFGDMAVVMVTLAGETEERKLFNYFHDEISFTPEELVGLTVDQANDLRHAKDVAYLRS
jgi:hypothetical protein